MLRPVPAHQHTAGPPVCRQNQWSMSTAPVSDKMRHYHNIEQKYFSITPSTKAFGIFLQQCVILSMPLDLYYFTSVPFQSWSHYGVSWLSLARFQWQHLHTVPGRWEGHLRAQKHAHVTIQGEEGETLTKLLNFKQTPQGALTKYIIILF